MATIKSYTDLSQSKKLAKILPLKSADMYWSKDFDGSWFVDLAEYTSVKIPKYVGNVEEHLLPCWSLASLLEVLKQHCERLETTVRINKNYNVFASGDGFTYRTFDEYPDGISNLIDACVAMIEKLNELNLL